MSDLPPWDAAPWDTAPPATPAPGDFNVIVNDWLNWRHPLGWELPFITEARAQARARENTAIPTVFRKEQT